MINLKGIGIGDGFMSPPDSALYGDELYQARWAYQNFRMNFTDPMMFIFLQMGLIDGTTRDECLALEDLMKSYAANDQWLQAWAVRS